MFSKPLSHVRHNPVAYLALFVALGGTAFAARPLITGADVQNGSLTDADIAAANKDGAAETPSLRTLGSGARQAMHGNAKLGTSHFSHTIPAVHVVGAQQSIPSGGRPTVLDFGGELYDTAALHKSTTDTSRLRAPVAGVYRISANVSWPLSNPTGYRDIRLIAIHPGEPATLIAIDRRSGFTQSSATETASTEYKLAAGDSVEVEAGQNSGGALPVSKRSYTMSWVAPG
jgi:hypothetical protein